MKHLTFSLLLFFLYACNPLGDTKTNILSLDPSLVVSDILVDLSPSGEILFDGISDFVEIPHEASFDNLSDGFIIEFDFSTLDRDSVSILASKSYGLAGENTFAVYIDTRAIVVLLTTTDGFTPTTFSTNAPGAIDNSIIYSIKVIYDLNDLYLYINDIQINSVAITEDLAIDTQPITLGAEIEDFGVTPNYFHTGTIENFKISKYIGP